MSIPIRPPPTIARLAARGLAAACAAAALAFGAAGFDAGRPGAAPAGPSLFESLVLMRWGYGALDWLLPDPTGERDERDRKRAG